MERRASPPGRTSESPVPTRPKNYSVRHRFLIDQDLQMRGHVFVQFDRTMELANRLERLVQLDLPPIDVEALLSPAPRQYRRP